jgi:hypothetical protein
MKFSRLRKNQEKLQSFSNPLKNYTCVTYIMVLSQNIQNVIEEEINREVNERITRVLEMISKTYNIKYARLLKDYSSMDHTTQTCCGTTKTGKRCQRPGKNDGFCKAHMSQKPDVRVVTRSSSSPPKVVHTHTIPPLFMKGCPACDAMAKKPLGVLRS